MKKLNLKTVLALVMCLAMLPCGGLQAFAEEGDITAIYISGGDAIEFDPSETSYTVNVPYYNGEYKMPVVYAVTSDGSRAEVTYPDAVTSGAEITVDGYSESYTLALNPVGDNLYKNGDFELTGPEDDNWTYTWSGLSLWPFGRFNPYSGQYTMMQFNTGSYQGIVPNSANKVILNPNKTYIVGFASRLGGAEDTAKSVFFNEIKNMKKDNKNLYWFADSFNDTVKIELKKPEANTNVDNGVTMYKADGTVVADSDGRRDDCTRNVTMTSEWTYYPAVIKPTENVKLIQNMWRRGISGGTDPGTYPVYVYDGFYAGELMAARVNITDNNGQSQLAAAPGSSLELTAEVLNQTGNKAGLENASGTWSVAGNDNVTIDENGKVTVAADASGKALVIYTVTPNVENSTQKKVCGVKEITIGESSADCSLKAVKVGDFFVSGITADKTSYTAYVPYKYTADDFRTVAMPHVTAWTTDSAASCSVEYPKTVRGGIVKLTVTNGDFARDYFITLEVVGDNYYLDGGMENGNMNDRKTKDYWTYNGQGASSFDYVADETYVGAGNQSGVLSVRGNYLPVLKQKNGNHNNPTGASGDPSTALKPTKPGFDYLFTALSMVNESCIIYASWNGLSEYDRIKHYTVSDENIASMNPGGNKRDGSDDSFNGSVGRFMRTISIYREGDAESRYPDTSYNCSRDRTLYIDEVYASELTVASIGLTEGAEVTLDGTGKEVNLAAQAKNAYGNTAGMEYAAYSYELFGNYDGVSIADGKLVVSPEAKPGTVNVKITCTPNFKSVQCPTGVEPISTLAQIKLAEQITVSNAKIAYTKTDSGVALSFEGVNDTDLTSFAVVTAVYNAADGKTTLADVFTETVQCAPGEVFNYSKTVQAAQGQMIKTFVFGDLKNIKPIRLNGEYTVQ